METGILTFIKNHLHNIAELISLIIAIIYYPYLKGSFMKWFLPFLGFIFIGELVTAYGSYYNQNEANTNIYDVIGIVECIFYNYFFYQFCKNSILKKLIVLFAFIGVLIYSIGLVFHSNSTSYHITGLIISGFLLSFVSLACIYFKFVNEDNSNNILTSEPEFWIALGVSLFFSCTSIVFCLHDFILAHDLNLFGSKLYKSVPRFLCIVLYSCISIAIILCKKKTTRS